MSKPTEKLDDARRQGQFEGQVLTTLTEIKSKMDAFNSSFTNLETRVRANETTLTAHNEMFKDSENAHRELFDKIKELAGITDNVVTYQTKQRGFLIAVGTIGPIVASLITAGVLKLLFK